MSRLCKRNVSLVRFVGVFVFGVTDVTAVPPRLATQRRNPRVQVFFEKECTAVNGSLHEIKRARSFPLPPVASVSFLFPSGKPDRLDPFFPFQGPLKEASKFAQQLSGAVNEKVMGAERAAAPTDSSTSDVGAGAAAWEGPAEAVAGAGAGGAAGVGMANGWKPPTSELGMEKKVELANDVPSELDAPNGSSVTSELSIDEQVQFFYFFSR